MNILCITHADFETPGIIEDWARDNNHAFVTCKPYKHEACPSMNEFDTLIVMGGPQDAWDIQTFPYLAGEIALIQQAISQNKVVLGFCLGAQLIGEALGSRTGKSPHKEIGVFPISLTEEGKNDMLLKDFPAVFPVVHWHNDMPGLTDNATLLAASAGCPRQIIKYAPRTYGFQCHLEITKVGIERMIKECPNDVKSAQFTQTAEELLVQDYDTINGYMVTILDKIVKL